MGNITSSKLTDWLVPVLLGACVTALWGIVDKLATLNTTMAVAVTRIDEHEKRLNGYDAIFRAWTQSEPP